MRIRFIIAIVALAGAHNSPAIAQTNELHVAVLRTLDGRSITNATVKTMNAAFAIVDFDGGGERIALTNLPPDIQTRLGFNAADAQAATEIYEKKKRESQQANAESMRRAEEAQKDKLYRIVDDKPVPISKFVMAIGNVAKITRDGIVLRGIGSMPVSVNGLQSIGGQAVVHTEPPFPGNKDIFIHCPVRGITTGHYWNGYCFRTGEQTLTLKGESVVVEKYDTGLSYSTHSDAIMTRLPGTPIKSINTERRDAILRGQRPPP